MHLVRCFGQQRHKSFAERPADVPSGQIGLRLLAWTGGLAERCHLSICQIQALAAESWGVRLSIGALSAAQGRVASLLTRTQQAVIAQVCSATRMHVGETSHQRAGAARWRTWGAVGVDAACFQFLPVRYRAQHLLGEQPPGVIISDGYGVYHWLPAKQHQLCWAHVVRLLREIAEHPGDADRLWRRLLRLAQTAFRVRHRFERSQIDEARYLRRIQQLRWRLHAELRIGAQLPWSRSAGRCAHLLAHEARLWTPLTRPPHPADQQRRGARAARRRALTQQQLRDLVAARRAIPQPHPDRGRNLPQVRLERAGRRVPDRRRRARPPTLPGRVWHRTGAVRSVRVNVYKASALARMAVAVRATGPTRKFVFRSRLKYSSGLSIGAYGGRKNSSSFLERSFCSSHSRTLMA